MHACHTGGWCLCCCCRQTCYIEEGGTQRLWSPPSAPPCWLVLCPQCLMQLKPHNVTELACWEKSGEISTWHSQTKSTNTQQQCSFISSKINDIFPFIGYWSCGLWSLSSTGWHEGRLQTDRSRCRCWPRWSWCGRCGRWKRPALDWPPPWDP